MTQPSLFVHDMALHGLRVELLSRRAYSAMDPVRTHSLGIALERQKGVHAIGSDQREDFDTWPGMLSYTPPGVDVFSESATGGEYLVARRTCGLGVPVPQRSKGRAYWAGHAPALAAAQHLRRLLLDAAPDVLAVEQSALAFLNLQTPTDGDNSPDPHPQLRSVYGRVLDRIAHEFAQPLSIAQLAQAEGKTPLRFLREFTRLVGTTPHAFIVETRIQAARAMVRKDAAPLASIALDCGFTHQSHMGVAFRKVLGRTPGQYLAAWRQGQYASPHPAGSLPAGQQLSNRGEDLPRLDRLGEMQIES